VKSRPVAPRERAVDVLQCGTCGAPVAFGESDVLRCPHCGGEVPVPEAHRALRDAARARAGARRDAEVVAARALRPPPAWVRGAATVFDSTLVFLFVGWLPALLISLQLMGGLSLWLVLAGVYPNSDAIPAEVWLAALVAPGLVMIVGSRLLGIFAGTRLRAYALLRDGLRARPPVRAGGPASCRLCGAPLDVPDDRLVVGCPYCEADNLVRVGEPEARREVASNARLAADLRVAMALAIEERSARRRELVKTLVRRTVKAAILFGVFAVALHAEDVRGRDPSAYPWWGMVASVGVVVLLIVFIVQGFGGDAKRGEAARESARPDR
jgi:DNA-directed RNA polymerase subunit RPC12/RpoP